MIVVGCEGNSSCFGRFVDCQQAFIVQDFGGECEVHFHPSSFVFLLEAGVLPDPEGEALDDLPDFVKSISGVDDLGRCSMQDQPSDLLSNFLSVRFWDKTEL